MVRIQGYEEKDPTRLSVGQKQRVAIASALTMQPQALLGEFPMALSAGDRAKVVIASVIAMRPEIIILDELTAQVFAQAEKLREAFVVPPQVTRLASLLQPRLRQEQGKTMLDAIVADSCTALREILDWPLDVQTAPELAHN